MFEVLDKPQAEGKIRHYGVSVETVEEGLFCLGVPGVRSRRLSSICSAKTAGPAAPESQSVGRRHLVRLPLASGLLTGKFTETTTFSEGDHRNFNANGEQFNVGETFAGLRFEKGLSSPESLLGLPRAEATWPVHPCDGFWTVPRSPP